MPVENGFLKWFCEERPDVIFRDVVDLRLHRGEVLFHIPRLFLECVEGRTFHFVSMVAHGGAARVEVDELRPGLYRFRAVESIWRRLWHGVQGNRVRKITITFEAVRRGFGGVRYEFATDEEMAQNERFYAHQRFGVK